MARAITVATAVGKIYQHQQSNGLGRWSNYGVPVIARTTELTSRDEQNSE